MLDLTSELHGDKIFASQAVGLHYMFHSHVVAASEYVSIFSPTGHVAVGDRASDVAAARVWNSSPPNVTLPESLSIFKRRLKT